jgi:hypothetical protein
MLERYLINIISVPRDTMIVISDDTELAPVADLALVNIQADVIHRLHGGASLVFLNQRPLSSAFLHQALLLRPIHSNLSSTAGGSESLERTDWSFVGITTYSGD